MRATPETSLGESGATPRPASAGYRNRTFGLGSMVALPCTSRPQQAGAPVGLDETQQGGEGRRSRLFGQLSIGDLVGDPEGQAAAKGDRQLLGHALGGD